MFHRIFADNYKCLVNFELNMSESVLLHGPNGSGKTSVLDVFSALQRLLSGVARITDQGVFPERTLTRWQNRNIQVFELDASVGSEGMMTYRLEVEHQLASRRARVVLEKLTCEGRPLFVFNQGEVQLFRDDYSAGPEFPGDWRESALARVASRNDNTRLTSFLELVRSSQLCGLDPRRCDAESRGEDHYLARDGSNFSAWYRHMVQERQDLASEYINAVKDIIPGLASIRLATVGEDARAFMIAFEEGDERYELRLDEISDGQRAILVNYALLYMTKGQNVCLFLDEPDNFIALPEIQPWLMSLSDACGTTIPQAVLCSHHPEAIDYFGSESTINLSRERSGLTKIGTLVPPAEDCGLKLSEVVARGWEK